MTDLDGRAYEKLENAYRHHREFVADCSCRGNPWDEEALARHRAYAEAAQAETEKPVAAAEKPRSEQRVSRRERAAARSQRWARSGWRDRAGNEGLKAEIRTSLGTRAAERGIARRPRNWTICGSDTGGA